MIGSSYWAVLWSRVIGGTARPDRTATRGVARVVVPGTGGFEVSMSVGFANKRELAGQDHGDGSGSSEKNHFS